MQGINTDVGHDMRLRFPFSWYLSGASKSGKTTKVLNFLRSHKTMTDNPECENIIYCYKEWQDGFEKISDEGVVTEWIQGLPQMHELKEKLASHKDSGGCILVIDDFGSQISLPYVDLFTVISHHNRCCVLLLNQNLFSKNPAFREISLNSTYISVFKNPRDGQQIKVFARQVFPNKSKFVEDSFEEATKLPHSYLFFDTHQERSDKLRVRSNILPHEAPMIIWSAITNNGG